jgi:uncharacterized ParB-like nuclease family protein
VTAVTAIPIELIRLDGGTQIRACSTFQTKVDEYAMAMGEGAQFPPLTVFWDGAEYWLADGFHRMRAHERAWREEIDAEVRAGTRRDAILYAVGANDSHGLRRSNRDKRNAVETLLKDPEWSAWSDREIARRCLVGGDMVGTLRRSLASVVERQIGVTTRTVRSCTTQKNQ